MDNQTNTTSTTQRVEIPQDVHNFLSGILTDGNISTTDEETREDMIQELYQRLDTFLTSVIVENLPPEHLEEFIKMNEAKKSRQEIEQCLQSKVPNIQEVFARAFMEFRDLYLGNVNLNRNAPAEANTNGKKTSSDNTTSSNNNN